MQLEREVHTLYSVFVVMGYGKKISYKMNRAVNLDRVYSNLIAPAIDSYPKLRSIRSDEIVGSDSIDKSMYQLLLSADIVIADISTLNANAMYELGVRHALRPYATIVMKMKDDHVPIPFDVGHLRLLEYRLSQINSKETHKQLSNLLENAIYNLNSNDKITDSPLFEALPEIENQIHKLSFNQIMNLRTRLYHDGSIRQQLDIIDGEVKQNHFDVAAQKYRQLARNIPDDAFFVQQEALMLGKAGQYDRALTVLKKLHPESTTDSETLGIYAGIEKRLSDGGRKRLHLKNALQAYQRGYYIKQDYYNGENYVNCLVMAYLSQEKADQEDLRMNLSQNNEHLTYLRVAIKQNNQNVLELAKMAHKMKPNDYWPLATIAASMLLTRNTEYLDYQSMFLEQAETKWQKDSFLSTMALRKRMLSANNE